MKCYPMLPVAVLLACLLPIATTGQVPEPAPVVSGAGGGTSANGTTYLYDTIGQPVLGVMSESGQVHKAGFWYLIDQLHIGPTVAVLIVSFQARPGTKGVHLEWEVSSSHGLEGFAIYRSSGSEDDYVLLNDGRLLSANEMEFVDTSIRPNHAYWYRLGARDEDGEFLSLPQRVITPRRELELSQNYPNPFNPTTRIDFYLPAEGHVSLVVYDITGRRIKTLVDREARYGHTSVVWDGTDSEGQRVSSGVYFYRLTAGTQIMTRKLVVLK